MGFISHKQPVLEKKLRNKLAESPFCDLRPQSTVIRIEEDANWTYCTYVDAQGAEHILRGKFLIGADGKTGFTRKHYLEPKGVHMEKAHQ